MVGFCFPVHGWWEPKTLSRFVRKMRIQGITSRTYCFTVCTAGDTVGMACREFQRLLGKRGLSCVFGSSVIMPESYVGLPFMDVDSEPKERVKIAAAIKKISAITRQIERRESGFLTVDTGRWKRINTYFLGRLFRRFLITDRPFRVNTTLCSRCNLCQKVCPVHNIAAGDEGLPVWLHNQECLTCFACYHHCPKKAIEFGIRTRGKGQYFFHGKSTDKP